MKAAFAARVNLVTQVAESANFSSWLRKSEKPTKKLLAFSALKGASQHLHVSKVIRESSCVYLFFFRFYFLFLWGSASMTTCIFLETTYLILATLQMVAGGKKCCFKGVNFTGYRLIRRTLNTILNVCGGQSSNCFQIWNKYIKIVNDK